jgi:hypothetical protein
VRELSASIKANAPAIERKTKDFADDRKPSRATIISAGKYHIALQQLANE